MNLRTLLFIAGLALPIVAFAILSQTAPMSQKTTTVKAPIPPTKEEKAAAKKAAEEAAKQAATQAQQEATPVSDEVANEARMQQDMPSDNSAVSGPMSAPPVILPPIGENSAANPPMPAEGAAMPGPTMAQPNQPQQPAERANIESGVGGPTLQEAIEKTKDRLGYLEKMHPSEWPEERKRHHNAPPTLAQAKEFNRNRLAKLATMTPEQWEQEKIAVAQRARRQWEQLSPEKQLENVARNRAMLPDTGSMPAPSPSPYPQPGQPQPMPPEGMPAVGPTGSFQMNENP